MPHRFFLTGLPRSRTAWCANWLTQDESFCWHDGLANCASLEKFGERMTGPICGDSDSGLAFFYEELRDLYPDAQWAVVRRNPEQVVASLIAMDSYEGVPKPSERELRQLVEAGEARLDAMATDPRIFTISFTDLATREGARALWWHLLRDRVAWNGPRWEMLRHMNVTVRSGEVALSLHAAAQLFGREAA